VKKEATVFEYQEIIIPLHEQEVESNLMKANKYPAESIERKALILAARLKEIHVQYLKLHIVELEGNADSVSKEINENKILEEKVKKELEELDIDVREL
jgi:hypothetical protein